jgi:hypothetical protein
MPVIYYHGRFESKLSETRAKHAKNAGAFGEAYQNWAGHIQNIRVQHLGSSALNK